MNNISKADIETIFLVLRERRHLLLSNAEGNFADFVTFFEGFFFGINTFYSINLQEEISEWFEAKVHRGSSRVYWFTHFRDYYKQENEQQKIELLLSCLEEFLLFFLKKQNCLSN